MLHRVVAGPQSLSSSHTTKGCREQFECIEAEFRVKPALAFSRSSTGFQSLTVSWNEKQLHFYDSCNTVIYPNRSKGQCLLYYLQYWLLPKETAWETPVAWTQRSYANQNNLKSSFGNRGTLWEMRVVGLGKVNVPVYCCLLSFYRKQ